MSLADPGDIDISKIPLATGVVPGPGLGDIGHQQAQAVGAELYDRYGDDIAGIYVSDLLRTQETAAPLAGMAHMDTQELAGLTEIGAGIYNGLPRFELPGLLYHLTSLAWALGDYSVPIPGSPDLNGAAFEDRFGGAVQTIYDNTLNAGGPTTDVAFSSGGPMMFWTLMNVDNPNLSLYLTDPVSQAGQIVLKGHPGDWTLVSWNGAEVPQDPGLTTDLFVDVRDLITAPQMTAYHIGQALLTGDPTTITEALQAGVKSVGMAITQFPESVASDIDNALTTGNLGDLNGLLGGLDLSDLLKFVSDLGAP